MDIHEVGCIDYECFGMCDIAAMRNRQVPFTARYQSGEEMVINTNSWNEAVEYAEGHESRNTGLLVSITKG